MNESVDQVCERAGAAFATWRKSSVDERIQLLNAIADRYEEQAQAVAETIARDMGKPVTQGRGEATTCAAIFRYYATNAETLLEPQQVPEGPSSGVRGRVELHPTGVILAVMPWNFPHYQLARVIAPNLLLGNTVVFKHASICRASAEMVEQMVLDSGAPEGVVIHAPLSHAQVEEAVAHPAIAGVSFTGGDAAGAVIAQIAAKHLKKSVLELGGSDPFIAFDITDVEETAQVAARMRLANAGQTCTSPKRVIVDNSIFDRFVAAYREAFLTAAPADPLQDDTVMGPLSSEGAADELRGVLRDAMSDGVQLEGDIEQLTGEGREFSPMLIVEPDRTHEIWRTELFGPVTMIVGADSVDEAITIANDSPYGLGATVYTDSPEAGQRFVTEVETGMVSLNTPRGGNPAFPFGGVKRSGLGRELGKYGLEEFANLKLIVDV